MSEGQVLATKIETRWTDTLVQRLEGLIDVQDRIEAQVDTFKNRVVGECLAPTEVASPIPGSAGGAVGQIDDVLTRLEVRAEKACNIVNSLSGIL